MYSFYGREKLFVDMGQFQTGIEQCVESVLQMLNKVMTEEGMLCKVNIVAPQDAKLRPEDHQAFDSFFNSETTDHRVCQKIVIVMDCEEED